MPKIIKKHNSLTLDEILGTFNNNNDEKKINKSDTDTDTNTNTNINTNTSIDNTNEKNIKKCNGIDTNTDNSTNTNSNTNTNTNTNTNSNTNINTNINTNTNNTTNTNIDYILNNGIVKFDNKLQTSMFFVDYKSIHIFSNLLKTKYNITIPKEIIDSHIINQIPEIIKEYTCNLKKRCKKSINTDYICLGRKLDNKQCTRKKHNGTDFCKSHLIKLSNGRYDEPTQAIIRNKRGRKRKVKFDPRQYDNEYITLWEDIINGQKVLLDGYNNIYTYDLQAPQYIGKKYIDTKIDLSKYNTSKDNTKDNNKDNNKDINIKKYLDDKIDKIKPSTTITNIEENKPIVKSLIVEEVKLEVHPEPITPIEQIEIIKFKKLAFKSKKKIN
jgi:hypothetical protein